jgi:phospholipid-binding lipoprotein MlaA
VSTNKAGSLSGFLGVVGLMAAFVVSYPATGWSHTPLEKEKRPVVTPSGQERWAGDVTIELEKKTRPLAPSQGKTPSEQSDTGKEPRPGNFEDAQDPFSEQTKEAPAINDPYEGYNRFMYKVNDGLADHVLDPVTKGYKAVVPEGGRIALKNMLANLASPQKFVGSALQGDGEKTGRVLKRLLINSTFGVVGLFDVAKDRYGLSPVNEDFGQVLGAYGVPAGPYLVLPVFGPSSARDAAGRVVDGLLNPINYVAPGVSQGLGIAEQINTYSIYGDQKKALDQSTVDPYESVKHFYNQRREKQVKE